MKDVTPPLFIGQTHFDFSRPYVMGIVNLTPDSFVPTSRAQGIEAILYKVDQLIQEGADIIDVGAESTRPGAEPVSVDEEWSRLEPFLKVYKTRFSCPLSLDTTKSELAKRALEYGVDLLNDVSGLADLELAKLATLHKKPLVIMHTQGTPQTMQLNPHYSDVVQNVVDDLKQKVALASSVGVNDILLDPGIGFGKTLNHNLALLKHIPELLVLKCPLLLGTSRKSFIGQLTQENDPEQRLEGSLASVVVSALKGAQFFRVHDVKATQRALTVAMAIERGTHVF